MRKSIRTWSRSTPGMACSSLAEDRSKCSQYWASPILQPSIAPYKYIQNNGTELSIHTSVVDRLSIQLNTKTRSAERPSIQLITQIITHKNTSHHMSRYELPCLRMYA